MHELHQFAVNSTSTASWCVTVASKLARVSCSSGEASLASAGAEDAGSAAGASSGASAEAGGSGAAEAERREERERMRRMAQPRIRAGAQGGRCAEREVCQMFRRTQQRTADEEEMGRERRRSCGL